MNRSTRHWVVALLALAFVLRTGYGLVQDPLSPYQDTGGDSGWYLLNGLGLMGGISEEEGGLDLSRLQPPPVYLIFIGAMQRIFSPENAIIAIRLIQAVLSTLTCYFIYRLGSVVGSERAGLLAMAALAVSPVFVIEAAQITTETVYMFWIAAGLWLYVEGLRPPNRIGVRSMLGAGILLGLAVLTRAVLLLFPLGLAIFLFLRFRPHTALRIGAAFLAAYLLTVSTWTVYNLVRWDRFVIAGEGFASMFYIGARGWEGPQAVDQNLDRDTDSTVSSRQSQYLQATSNVIASDPVAYVARRASELLNAYAQPHGTTYFSGESLRTLASNWLSGDRSLNGLVALIQGDQFIPKLILYIFHIASIGLGLVGMWRTRGCWFLTVPLIGFVAYITLIHLVLFALPRYIFPTSLIWYLFAALALFPPRLKTSVESAA